MSIVLSVNVLASHPGLLTRLSLGALSCCFGASKVIHNAFSLFSKLEIALPFYRVTDVPLLPKIEPRLVLGIDLCASFGMLTDLCLASFPGSPPGFEEREPGNEANLCPRSTV